MSHSPLDRLVGRRALLTGAGAVAGAAFVGACELRGADRASAVVPTPAVPRTSVGPVPALWVVSRTRSGRIESWVLRSDSVPGDIKVKVLLPVSYDSSPNRRYPVLYLLHGSTGDAGSWLAGGTLVDTVGRRDVIVVMPDGGAQGWYLDWVQTSPAVRWESLHMRALIPAVDGAYRTIATKAGRGIAGISMGGFGAIHYAQAYPELFAAVSSFSGPLSLRTPRDWVALDAQAVNDKPAYAIFGRTDCDARAALVDPIAHVDRLRGLRVGLYAGDGRASWGVDHGEETMLATGRLLAQRLSDAGVPFAYEILPGGHEWAVWGPAFAHDLPGLLGALAPAA